MRVEEAYDAGVDGADAARLEEEVEPFEVGKLALGETGEFHWEFEVLCKSFINYERGADKTRGAWIITSRLTAERISIRFKCGAFAGLIQVSPRSDRDVKLENLQS